MQISDFSDFAKIFGCLVGLPNELTAITLVAFGTSQIDLFASRIAAINDPTADNSIGNVVAANAIGVFLGQPAGSFIIMININNSTHINLSDRAWLPLACGCNLLGG